MIKKLLITFIVSIIWFIGFSFAELWQFFLYSYMPMSRNSWQSSQNYTINYSWDYSDLSDLCYVLTTSSSCSQFQIIRFDWNSYIVGERAVFSYTDNSCYVCADLQFSSTNNKIWLYYPNGGASYWRLTIIDKNSFLNSFYGWSQYSLNPSVSSCPTCDEKLTSFQCQQEYNLIPIEDVDQNYCEINNLCPAWSWSVECPNEWFSRLSINWIDQDQSLLYQVNIPDYLSYDFIHYSDQISDLNLNGYNEDQDYIQWIIDVQNYKPTSEDFTSVFMNIIPYMKIIIFVLFLMLVWKMLKKVFK